MPLGRIRFDVSVSWLKSLQVGRIETDAASPLEAQITGDDEPERASVRFLNAAQTGR